MYMAMCRKVCGPKLSPDQTGGMVVRTAYGRKASKASPAKRSEPNLTVIHIKHASIYT